MERIGLVLLMAAQCAAADLSLWYTGTATAGQTLCFLTVFAPQPAGSTRVTNNAHVEVNGDQAVGVVGDWEFRFGPQKLASLNADGKTARFTASRNTQGQPPYLAAVLTGGSEKKLEWAPR